MLKRTINRLSAEEAANMLTHGFGLILSIIGFVVLVYFAAVRGDIWHVLAATVYGLSLVTLYAASTFYHGTVSPRRKAFLRLVDHCCIYILIAGSYTPFALITLGQNSTGRSLLLLVWGAASIGIAAKVIFGTRFPIIYVGSYLVMGWFGIMAIEPLFVAIGFAPIALVIASGLAYSFGVIFFAWERLRHNHAIFHMFVLAGSILHFIAVFLYVSP